MANNRKNDEIILASLLSTPTIRAAAAACGVSESVIYSRLKDPSVFKDDDGQIYCYFGGLWGGQLQWYGDNGVTPVPGDSGELRRDR